MATYKVLQDIEAEDKFVGPLTLKQFILAGVTLVSGYLAGWLGIVKHIWFLDIILVPIMLVSGFLAFPWGRDQPTEVWLLAKLRFMLKPRRRIWDQTGMQELVTITAPRHAEQLFTSDNLSQNEVRSRLKALANTIDSRGWAVKNVNLNLYAQPGYGTVTAATSDRLVDASVLAPQGGISTDIQAADDIMDEQNNPTAQHLDQMIQASSAAHREDTLQHLQDVRDNKKPDAKTGRSKSNSGDGPPADYWFMNQPKAENLPKDYATFDAKTVHPGDRDDGIPNIPDQGLTAEEIALLDREHHKEEEIPAYGNTRVIEPLDSKHKTHTKHASATHPASKTAKAKPKAAKAAGHKSSAAKSEPKPPMTKTPDPDTLRLANDNNLSVATLAHEAKKNHEPELPDGEVVVSWR